MRFWKRWSEPANGANDGSARARLESDREWIDLRIDAGDPEALIAALWAQALADANRD